MEIILMDKGAGKTAELIRRSAETGFYILTKDLARARSVVKQAREMGLNIPFPITVAEYMRSSGLRGSYIKNIYIDDADDILLALFGRVNIEAITITRAEGGNR